ncbi:helix-turn-helix transcriptional regulator [uncultured Algimonas sp.]|uniref:helix-turn-helix domain-containing protein n=1 Tax=uncultured Algimonas sp. TaxID=1547920 RepID=UPI00261690DF|nr:helix-turn-helix transcriptional regulator [uncultured Algimonas sp.]
MSLAKRLKDTRKKHGLSQSELAKQVEVSQPSIANWERGGHTPRRDALDRIAKALDTDPTWLLSGEMPASRNPAHQHLAKPIHHIAVYDWPSGPTDPRQGQPVRYLAVAGDTTDLFALNAVPETGFPEGSFLIFSATERRLPGQFLAKTRTGCDLSERTLFGDDILARLVYSVVPH